MIKEGFTVWFTGLSGAGKSTLAASLNKQLAALGVDTEILDGDAVRSTLSSDLSFSREDRALNIRRIAFVAGLLAKHRVCVLVAAISPYRAARDEARQALSRFIEVYVQCPLEVCEARDTKGLYKKARAGQIANFTGVSDAYEPPDQAEVVVDTSKDSIEKCVSVILAALRARGFLN